MFYELSTAWKVWSLFSNAIITTLKIKCGGKIHFICCRLMLLLTFPVVWDMQNHFWKIIVVVVEGVSSWVELDLENPRIIEKCYGWYLFLPSYLSLTYLAPSAQLTSVVRNGQKSSYGFSFRLQLKTVPLKYSIFTFWGTVDHISLFSAFL